ncbi:GNAT family N-acetyltransferase [Nocardioides sp. Arc9.136]|uniref:GNAT family N-acetyltransferase n=1 Tax=Nocardioides sp. Arc9.136 TaxID=2996826 RepID=UPI0026670ABF|nr:GNAT family N-acetyltransferase [Nocardioides sp. Arc9.136]WKN49432.1 GNAT family N-acetyltransferase [Nocardioides sp. Arc9.136]
MSTAGVVVRPRRPDDVPVLVEVLAEQQPGSRYPMRWPLPFPVERFLVRGTEEAAWVAELDGRVVGHVAVCSVPDPEVFGVPGDLVSVAVLFVGLAVRGTGTGGLLLDTAVAWAHEHERLPVLDVVPRHSRAIAVYRHRGWVEVGRVRPDWLPADEDDVVLMTLPPGPVERGGRAVPA